MIARRCIRFALVLLVGPCAFFNGEAAAQLLEQGPASQGPRILLPSKAPVSPGATLPQLDAAPQLDAGGGGFPNNDLPSIPAPVAVGDLGTVEGPVAGTLNDFNGGLGRDLWAGTSRSDAEMFLQRVPAILPSLTARLLFRKVLLTEAALPVGTGIRPFNALRIQRLLEAGEITDAGALAAGVRSRDPQTQRMQADAMLYAGRDIDVCGEATNERLQSAEPFWVALRAYCYHFDGDNLALELTRTVMEQQGTADDALSHLLDAFDDDDPEPPDNIPTPNAVHIRLLMRHGFPLPLNAVTDLGVPVSLAAAIDTEMPLEIRRPVAERLFRAGVLPASALGEVFAQSELGPGELNLAATIARSEPMMTALERIYSALESDGRADRRAELVHLSFQMGRSEGLFPQIAQLFAEDAAAIFPAPNWDAWSPLMLRGLLLAERPDAAVRWYNMLNRQIPAHNVAAKDGAFVLAIVQRSEPYITDAQDALTELAIQSFNPMVPAPIQARTVLVFGLFEALGLDMPPEALNEVQRLVSTEYQGRSPAPVIMQRVDRAALDGRRGELALGVLEALGPRGASDLAPHVIVRFVRALRTADMTESAQALASEAILTWQGG
jgi:hypothetical protein